MLTPRSGDRRLTQLRRYRNRPQPDLSLHFLADQFKRDVERPFRQLQSITELWRRRIPPDLLEHTRLDSLTRGTLRVTVDSSSRLYDLDQLLRSGLHNTLIREHQGPAFRKIKLVVGAIDPPPSDDATPPT
jgi:hypothetical protein